MKRILTLAAVAAALACGSNNTSNAAVSHNNPGTGTNTLKVVGSVGAISTPTTTTPSTTFSVIVTDGAGATVNGATVTVLNSSVPDGVVNLTQATGGSAYTGTVASYPSGDFRLNVVKGTDNVQGVVVGGPGMATINAPVVGSTPLPANTDLPVSWTTPAVGKQVTVSTRDMSFTAPDTGAYTIVAAQNPPRVGQRLRVDRFNEVEAAGGQVGSRLSVMYRVAIDPFNVQ